MRDEWKGSSTRVRHASSKDRSVMVIVVALPSASATRRRILAAGATLTGTGLVAACGGAGGGESPPSGKTAGPASIRLSVWSDVQDWDVYTAILNDFKAAQPAITVTGE